MAGGTVKKKSLFVFVVLVVAITLLGSHLTWGQELRGYGPGELGKVLIQVIDANSFFPVKENFEVCFVYPAVGTDPSLNRDGLFFSTDENGRAIIEIKPGQYYLQFKPATYDSIYEMDPSPILVPESRQTITVKNGQYTPVVKKAHRGGTLKIILTDASGNKIEPGRIFPRPGEIKARINAFGKIGIIKKGSYPHSWLSAPKDTFEDGEVVIKRLSPGGYGVEITFGNLGVKDIVVEGKAEISRGAVTECKIPISLTSGNITGIEGYIRDQNGNPLENLVVKSGGVKGLTDKNGRYRLLGVDSNETTLSIADKSFRAVPGRFILEVLKIKFTKGLVVRKDFSVDTRNFPIKNRR